MTGEPHRRAVSPQKLLCDLLKRQARTIMGDITECPSASLPAHLARLMDMRDTIDLAVRHDLIPPTESEVSGLNMANTLADLRVCLDFTRRTHRAPVFVNSRDTEISVLNQKIDLLAGLVAMAINAPMPEIFTNNIGENER
ncbi:MAG: hypothetical protein WDM76_09605 [Limisphaerales bacterium]